MARLATALALCAGARAYVAPVAPKAAVARSAFYGGGESSALDNLEGAPPGPVPNFYNPGGAWDPMNLADTTEFGPTLEWYRAAELKHCRVAMAAFVGFIAGGTGGTVFFDPPAKKWSLWDPVNTMKNWDDAKRKRGRLVELQNGRAAMFGVIGFVMAYKYPGTIPALGFFPHYMTGGKGGTVFFDPP